MVRGRIIGADARETIYRVYLYFVNEANKFKRAENGYFQKVQERVCKATGVSRKFVSRLLDEKDKLGPAPFVTPSKKRKVKTNKKKVYLEKKLQNKPPPPLVCNPPPLISSPPPLIYKAPPLIYSIVPLNGTKQDLTASDHLISAESVTLVPADPEEGQRRKGPKMKKFPYIQFESDSDLSD